jgi:predicted Fe-S protein YdhL (DUF1289 family)
MVAELDKDPLCRGCPRMLRPAEFYESATDAERAELRLYCCRDKEPRIYWTTASDPAKW